MIRSIDAAGLSALLEEPGDVVLLDVRQEYEYARGHLEGAVNIPMSVLGSEYGSLPKDRHIVVVCLIGYRSRSAAKVLEAAGYSRVSCLKGGMLAWKRYLGKGKS